MIGQACEATWNANTSDFATHRAGAIRHIVRVIIGQTSCPQVFGHPQHAKQFHAARVHPFHLREELRLGFFLQQDAAHAATTEASYLAVGPVFSTQTKDTGYGAVGLPLVAEAAEAAATVGGPP